MASPGDWLMLERTSAASGDNSSMPGHHGWLQP